MKFVVKRRPRDMITFALYSKYYFKCWIIFRSMGVLVQTLIKLLQKETSIMSLENCATWIRWKLVYLFFAALCISSPFQTAMSFLTQYELNIFPPLLFIQESFHLLKSLWDSGELFFELLQPYRQAHWLWFSVHLFIDLHYQLTVSAHHWEYPQSRMSAALTSIHESPVCAAFLLNVLLWAAICHTLKEKY